MLFRSYNYYCGNSCNKYLLNEEQCQILDKSLRISFNALCDKYSYENYIYRNVVIPYKTLPAYYIKQSSESAYSFKGWKKYNEFIKTLNKHFTIEKKKDIYSFVLFLFKHNETILSFILLRIVRPFLHSIKEKWTYWKYFSY